MKKVYLPRFIAYTLLTFSFLLPCSFGPKPFNSINAQPGRVHLSIAENRILSTSPAINVVWHTENRGGVGYVKFGITPDAERRIRASEKMFHGGKIYTARLKNLKHSSRYYYSCGSDEDGWTELRSFRTEPAQGSGSSFRVGVFGDTQNNDGNEEFQKTSVITGRLKDYAPDFTLHMGDIVENGSVTYNWLRFLSVAEPLNSVSPLMPVLGNHDVENRKGEDFQKPFTDFFDLFELPGDEMNYTFIYGKVKFIGLFTGCAQAAAETDQVKFGVGSPDYRWLEKELAGAAKNRKLDWTIVFMHYPVHSFGWSNVTRLKESLSPLLQKYKADLCLAGHRHVYERHIPLNNGHPVTGRSETTFQAGTGTIFVTNGSGGGNPTGLGGKDMPSMAFTPDRQMFNFAVMDVSPGSITYRVFDQENRLIDSFVIKK